MTGKGAKRFHRIERFPSNPLFRISLDLQCKTVYRTTTTTIIHHELFPPRHQHQQLQLSHVILSWLRIFRPTRIHRPPFAPNRLARISFLVGPIITVFVAQCFIHAHFRHSRTIAGSDIYALAFDIYLFAHGASDAPSISVSHERYSTAIEAHYVAGTHHYHGHL